LTTKRLDGLSCGDTVEVIADGPFLGEVGRIVLISDSLVVPYGVVFEWDVSSIPMYFEKSELERK
jgi:hypothetical protein